MFFWVFRYDTYFTLLGAYHRNLSSLRLMRELYGYYCRLDLWWESGLGGVGRSKVHGFSLVVWRGIGWVYEYDSFLVVCMSIAGRDW